jgi:predicted RNase H-like nuclease (RuvC/YqgF family)
MTDHERLASVERQVSDLRDSVARLETTNKHLEASNDRLHDSIDRLGEQIEALTAVMNQGKGAASLALALSAFLGAGLTAILMAVLRKFGFG